MEPAFQSTPTPIPAAASLASLASSVTSRTRIQPTPAVYSAVNTESVECQAWERRTASVSADIQERRVTEVRKRETNSAFPCKFKANILIPSNAKLCQILYSASLSVVSMLFLTRFQMSALTTLTHYFLNLESPELPLNPSQGITQVRLLAHKLLSTSFTPSFLFLVSLVM